MLQSVLTIFSLLLRSIWLWVARLLLSFAAAEVRRDEPAAVEARLAAAAPAPAPVADPLAASFLMA